MPVRFEWDEAKAEANLSKHGVSFVAASDVFSEPDHIEVDASRPEDKEVRRKAFGWVDGELIAVVFVVRGEVLRLISARRARMKEMPGVHRPIRP